MINLKKFSAAVGAIAMSAAIIAAVSGCSGVSDKTNVVSLEDFKNFMQKYPADKYTYQATTPPGKPQEIEARVDTNHNGNWDNSDGDIVASFKTQATRVLVVQNSIQLQLFFSFYAEGSGLSFESTPINLRNPAELNAYPTDKPVFVAIHTTKSLINWNDYAPGDSDPVGFAYVEPHAVQEYKADKSGWNTQQGN